jgi:hypothetical protein
MGLSVLSLKYVYEIVVARSLDSIPTPSGLAMTITYATNFGDITLDGEGTEAAQHLPPLVCAGGSFAVSGLSRRIPEY